MTALATRLPDAQTLPSPALIRTGADVIPRSGDVLHVTRLASVQFVNPIFFRVIRVHDWSTYSGWIWLDGYELNPAGDAVNRRSIFVQISGLRQVYSAPHSVVLSGGGHGTGRVRMR